MHSARWYRVADLKPCLSNQVRLQRQSLRGETWYVLSNPAMGRHVRLNLAAYEIVGRLNGERTVQQVWDRSLQHGHDVATQDEVIDILAQLREAQLVQFDRAADFDVMLPHLEQMVRPRGRSNLLAWRVPLGNPAWLLDRLQPVQAMLFSRIALAIWLALAVSLLVLGVQHASRLFAFGQLWLVTPRFAALALFLFVPIKLIHELAHGLAVRRWGGEVREAGFTLMLLVPVPYVNASAASSFGQRRHRIMVGAAGIMAEVVLAALALPLWLWLGDGLLRDAAFATLVISGVSTVVFNLNPFQRLDGYYILTDALELPNLGPRSRTWWVSLVGRRVLRVPGSEAMPVAKGEAPWLAAYAPMSWLSGVLIALLSVLWLGQVSLVLGLVAGGLLFWQMLLRPVARLMAQLKTAALTQSDTAQRWHRLLLGAGAVLALALLVPVPQSMLIQGVVWPPDQAQLRADESGLIETVLARDGEVVKAGDVVLQLANPQLESSRLRQVARISALEARLIDAMPGDVRSALNDGRAGDAKAELAAAQAALARLDERAAALAVVAHTDGRVALPKGSDLPGQFVRQGSLIGQVLTGAPLTVRVAVPEALAADVRNLSGDVGVWLAASPRTAHAAALTRGSGGAVMQLPSAALSAKHGGELQTDPRDPDDIKLLQPVVLMDVRLNAGTQREDERMGDRAWVRFASGWSPLIVQVARAARRAVLRRFNPQF